jgi:hypothetical protein
VCEHCNGGKAFGRDRLDSNVSNSVVSSAEGESVPSSQKKRRAMGVRKDP